MKDISVSVKLLNNGFIILVGNRKYQHLYPENIWHNFPQQFKSILSESAAVLFTRHFIFLKNCRIIYNFPPPVIDSLFFHGLLFSLPETVIEFSEFKHQTSGLIKTLFNRQQQIEFSGFPKSYSVTPLTNLHRNAVIPFTFGKDSLLTLGLIRELKIKPLLFFGAEPLSRYENEMRQKMIPQFEKAVGIKVNYWPITIGRLRQKGREMWGWDMLQLQYTLLLLPYIYFNQAKYLFYANEQNTNDYEVDKEGYKVNLYFEQSREWMLHANNLLRIFALPTLLGSLVEPVYELLVTYILHHRYQSLAQFQISCCGDAPQAKTDRWCGECFECGRMYIFLLAIGVDPLKLGFKRNLLKSRKKDLFDIFSKKNQLKKGQEFFKYYSEWILAFYLAYRRGVRGGYMDIFIKKLLKQTEAKKQWLINRYFKIYSAKTLPLELKGEIIKIYDTEIKQFKKEIRPFFATRGGRY